MIYSIYFQSFLRWCITSRCSAERSFSALRRMKTYLRSTMGQQRVSNIAHINIEKPYANSVVNNDMGRVIDIFGRRNGRDSYFFYVFKCFLGSYDRFIRKNIFSSYVGHRMTLVSFRLFRKNLGNLREFFGQMVHRPPWQKNARTLMTMSITSNGTGSFTVASLTSSTESDSGTFLLTMELTTFAVCFCSLYSVLFSGARTGCLDM